MAVRGMQPRSLVPALTRVGGPTDASSQAEVGRVTGKRRRGFCGIARGGLGVLT
jgi:hypothetical protein